MNWNDDPCWSDRLYKNLRRINILKIKLLDRVNTLVLRREPSS